MNPSFFQALVENGVWVLPHLVVLGVGTGLVFQLRDRNPTAATLCLAAFALMALSTITGSLISAWFVSAGFGSPLAGRARISMLYAVLSAVRAVVGLVGWGLLLAGLRKSLVGPEPRP